jgi:hypothetical protein
MLTHAFLGAVDINGVKPRSSKNQITVRVEQIFRTKSSVYVHYTMENNTKHSYHIGPPSAQQLQAEESLMFLQGLAHKQLDQRLLYSLLNVQIAALPVAHAESATEDIGPGETTHGVVAIRKDLSSPVVVQLVFDSQVKATFVP